MARLWTTGAETGHYLGEGTITALNSAGISVQSTDKVSGAFAFEITSGAGNTATAIEFPYSGALDRDFYLRSRVKIVNTPTASAPILSFLTSASALIVSVRASTGGQFQVWNETGTPAQLGSDLGAYNNTTWYRVGLHVRIPTGGGANSTVEVRLNGTTVYSASNIDLGSTSPDKASAGWRAAPGASKIIRLDDVALNDSTNSVNNSWLGDGHTIMLKPTADSARGSLWTGGAGGTTNLWDAVNNTPPVGVASASATNTSQIEHSGGTAQDYDATMQTYTVGGVGASDVVNVVFAVVSHGEDIATGSKTLNFSVVSNPAIAAGTAFDAGPAAVGTWATNWVNEIGAMAAAPSVTKGTAPVMRVSRPGTESRTASFALMGMMVEYETPSGDVTGTVTAGAIAVGGGSVTGTAGQSATGTVSAGAVVVGGGSVTASDGSGGGGGGPPTPQGTAAATNDTGGANTFAANLPTGMTTGEYVVLAIGSSGGSIVTPSGWTLIGSSLAVANPKVYVFGRTVDGSEGSTVTITKGASGVQNCGAAARRYSGQDASTPLDVTAEAFSDALATATSLAMDIDTVTANALVIGAVSVNSSSALITEPTGWTEDAENSGGRIIEIASESQATAGNLAGTWTWSGGRATAGVIFVLRPAAGGGGATGTVTAGAITVGGGTVTATDGTAPQTWQWFTDATPDSSMTAIGTADVTPTLSGAQTMGGILRLRVQLTASVSALHMEYSVDGTNWADIPNADNSGVSNAQNRWFTWANGAATAGNTIGATKLTGTQASGVYVESRGQALTVSGGNRTEFDLAFKVRWPPPDTTVLIRLLNNTTAITLPTAISLTTCAAADRLYTIDKADANASGGQNREVNHSAWPRMFHDGTYWWTFVVQPATSTSDLVYYRWSGSGAWTKATVAGGAGTITTTAETDIKHAPWLRTISGVPVVGVGLFPSSGNMRYLRGRIASGAITWASPVDIGIARPGSQNHATIDQGGFHWIAGINGTTGVWARRSTAADDGSVGYVPAFGSSLTLADSGVAAGDILALVPLASNRVLAIWRNGAKLRAAEVTNSGWGTAADATVTAAINIDDWGATLAGDGFVYLLHTDNAGTGGTWKTRKYNVGTPGWSAGTDPGAAQPTQNSNADGLVVTASGATDVYAFGTTVGSEGGQDRTVSAIKWNGSAWSNLGVVTPAGARGNGDDIAGPPVAAASAIPILYLHGDDDVSGKPFTYEYHVLTVAGDVTGTVSAGGIIVAGGSVTATAGQSATGTVTAGAIVVGGGSVIGSTTATGTVTGKGIVVNGGTVTATAGTGATGTVSAGAIAVGGGSITGSAGATGLVTAGQITIGGGTVTGGSTVSATGIVTAGGIVVGGGAVTATAGATGIVAAGVILVGGGAVTGSGGVSGGAEGVVASKGITVVGGTITATAGQSATGTMSAGAIAVGGGSVTGSAGATGLVTGKQITVGGSTVTATAGTGATGTVTGKQITVGGSTVSGTTTVGGEAVVIAGQILVGGGTVTATAGQAATGLVSAGGIVVGGGSIAATAGQSVTGIVATKAIVVGGSVVVAIDGSVLIVPYLSSTISDAETGSTISDSHIGSAVGGGLVGSTIRR